jgi:hypothetical protein
MRLPVDTTNVTHFVSAGPSEPVVDFDTKQPKVDPNTVAVNQVHLFVVLDGGTRRSSPSRSPVRSGVWASSPRSR